MTHASHMEAEVAIPHLGGAMNEKPVDTTAYRHRDFEFTTEEVGNREDASPWEGVPLPRTD